MAVTLIPTEGAVVTPLRNRPGRDRHRRGAARWVVLALVTLAALAMLVPFAFMLLNAFKSPTDYSSGGPLSWPTEFYTKGLRTYWTTVNFPLKLWNSALIAGSVAVLGVVVSLLNAYALGIGRVRGRLWIVGLFLLANMLPQEALIYPLYYVAKEIGLYNTRLSVIIIFTVIQSAFGTYLLASVLSTFPRSLLEAAALDGAGKWTVLWRVVFPNLRPTLAVLLIFFFIWTWNEFLIPLVMLIDNQTQTIPVALASLQGDRLMDAPTTNAGALISLVPAIIFFLIFQRTLARGITAGAEK
ncbi:MULTISPECIES: carbohydrate ABC transporter permease [unclassified Micromonospora]|uniref:carbohydrate ABC transporter permease n=1 Tax=unclassified Micromonospora TaxID=2617518 RepID=UPI000EF4C4D2|nr:MULTISPECIES: carbohydrate ABC transporter permease [unclassified Micromonospora]RLP86614.1 carbohydrate ABC transporter permease [Micromonospora sp. BL4]RLP89875.1 carbohydrate ABC transporter permease [Micromonospora sp. CV4]